MPGNAASGTSRREFLESTGFPGLFRQAFKQWRASLQPAKEQRRAQTRMADALGVTDTKNIRNWMNAVSAPASESAWAAVRAVLAEAPANAACLDALDAAFARARGIGPEATEASDASAAPGGTRACVWKAGRHMPAIRNIVEFRIRLGLNDPRSTGPCPVHAVLILGQAEREAAGRRVLIAFRELELFFETHAGHEARAETILGDDGPLPAGVSRISGGWRLEAPAGEDGLLLRDPTGGACLFMLDGKGAAAAPTTLEFMAKAGKVDIRDATTREEVKNGKRRAILDAIFRLQHAPEGQSQYPVGRGEVWQEPQG